MKELDIHSPCSGFAGGGVAEDLLFGVTNVSSTTMYRRRLIDSLHIVQQHNTKRVPASTASSFLHTFNTPDENFHASPTKSDSAPFAKLLSANRGEIATRINRAASELGISTAGIYSFEGSFHERGDFLLSALLILILCALLNSCFPDRFTQHRYKCDQAFELDSTRSPVAQYLDIPKIVDICVANKVEAVHPGYGFLSENQKFAQSLENKGIIFVGPTVENLQTFGDKTAARNIAVASQVPVVPGSQQAFASADEARNWIADPANKCSYPVIVKALMGGGGRGIRIVHTEAVLNEMFQQASNEAATAFGDGRCFVEKYVEQPRHIEVQCLGDGTGSVVHLVRSNFVCVNTCHC